MLVVAAALALAVLQWGDPAAAGPQPLITGVLWMGDSIAYDLAPGVETGLGEAGLTVTTYAFPGISLAGGGWLPRGETWLTDHLPDVIDNAPAQVVVWQLSRFDAPVSHEANVLAHTAFVDLALREGMAAVVFVTAPPIQPGVVPAGWPENWGDLTDVAYAVAEHYPGRVFVADSSAVWGPKFIEYADDGTPLRKPDGVHMCPLGATIFGNFLARWLDERFAGLTPTDPSTWPRDVWNDGRYYMPLDVCFMRGTRDEDGV